MKLLAQSNALKGYTGPTKRRTAQNLVVVVLAILAATGKVESACMDAGPFSLSIAGNGGATLGERGRSLRIR